MESKMHHHCEDLLLCVNGWFSHGILVRDAEQISDKGTLFSCFWLLSVLRDSCHISLR